MTRKITGIMACDPNGVIGKHGCMPWSYKKDIDFFTKTTDQQIIIMGYKTFQALPTSILTNRFNIVFSRQPYADKENIIFVKSIKEFQALECLPPKKECYVIGGGELARLFLLENLIDEFLLTRFNKCYDGDKFFPLDLLKGYKEVILYQDEDFTIYKFLFLKSTKILAEDDLCQKFNA